MIALLIPTMTSFIGFLGSLLGVGGGAFLMPMLVLGLDISPQDAMPISLACALATGISGTLLSGITLPALKRTLFFKPAAILGTLLGAPMARMLHGKYILYLFSLFLLLIAIICRPAKNGLKESVASLSESQINVRGMLITFASGVCVGLFGIGGGVLMVPLLRSLSCLSLKEAVQISLLIMISTSILGLLVHASYSSIPWKLCFLGVLGALPAGVFGGAMRKKISDKRLLELFVVFSVSMALVTLFKAWTFQVSL